MHCSFLARHRLQRGRSPAHFSLRRLHVSQEKALFLRALTSDDSGDIYNDNTFRDPSLNKLHEVSGKFLCQAPSWYGGAGDVRVSVQGLTRCPHGGAFGANFTHLGKSLAVRRRGFRGQINLQLAYSKTSLVQPRLI